MTIKMFEQPSNLKYWLLTFVIGVIVTIFSHYIITGKFLDVYFSSSDAENSNQTTKIQEPDPAITYKSEIKPIVTTPVEPKKDIRINEFKGNVGKWTALFHLTFDYTDKKIYGTYFYPNRPAVIYKITGKILNKNIELIEFTNNEITATCKLHTNDDICFSGVMNNIDGRNLNMNFCNN
jgi:hypothetical protein